MLTADALLGAWPVRLFDTAGERGLVGDEPAHAIEAEGQIRGRRAQLLIGDLASRDVTYVADDDCLVIFRSHRAQADFHGKLRPVASTTEQLQTCAHRACMGIALITSAMTDVPPTEALGQVPDQAFGRNGIIQHVKSANGNFTC